MGSDSGASVAGGARECAVGGAASAHASADADGPNGVGVGADGVDVDGDAAAAAAAAAGYRDAGGGGGPGSRADSGALARRPAQRVAGGCHRSAGCRWLRIRALKEMGRFVGWQGWAHSSLHWESPLARLGR